MHETALAICFSTIVLLTGGAPVTPTENPSPPGNTSSGILDIGLSTNRKQYGPTDPIVINVRVTNVGPAQVLWSHWRPVNWIVDLNIHLTNGARFTSIGMGGYQSPNLSADVLNAGQSVTLSAPLSSWGYQLDQPGNYEVVASVPTSTFQTADGGQVLVHVSVTPTRFTITSP